MYYFWVSVLALITPVVAQEVSFGTSFATGTIAQIYGKITDPVIGTYYDTAKPAAGAQLTVNFMPYRRRDATAIASAGTPFDFIPTKSAYMGYVSTKETVFGHLALTSNSSLHLTVPQFSTAPVSSLGPIPILSPAVLKDDASQISQFWSLDTISGELTFLNIQSGIFTKLPVALAPNKVTTTPEAVHLTNIDNTNGRFYFRKASIITLS